MAKATKHPPEKIRQALEEICWTVNHEDGKLYHGTDLESAVKIAMYGFKQAEKTHPESDDGAIYFTTNWKIVAMEWAKLRCHNVRRNIFDRVPKAIVAVKGEKIRQLGYQFEPDENMIRLGYLVPSFTIKGNPTIPPDCIDGVYMITFWGKVHEINVMPVPADN